MYNELIVAARPCDFAVDGDSDRMAGIREDQAVIKYRRLKSKLRL